jgi:hypothetical protein
LKFPYLSDEQIRDAARQLLGRVFGSPSEAGFHVDLEAVIYDYLCEKEDLSFNDEDPLAPEDGEEVLGKTLPRTGKILIHGPLKSSRVLGRYRFTVGHEIGHWVLHRPLVLADAQQLSLLADPQGYEFVSLNRSIFAGDKQQVPTEEWQANRFASYLLVDPELLITQFTRRFGTPPLPRREGGGVARVPNLHQFALETASRVARRQRPLYVEFGVSIEAMAVTLKQRGLVVDE